MRDEEDSEGNNPSRSFLNKMADKVATGEGPAQANGSESPPEKQRSRLNQYWDSVDQKTKDVDDQMLKRAMGEINSALSYDNDSSIDSTQSTTDTNSIHYITHNLTSLSSDTQLLLEEFDLKPDAYSAFLNRLIERIDLELESRKLSDEMEKWQDLYENFRIGLQLGFRYFSEAVLESGEDIPDQDDLGSPWNWHTWETMVGNLLNNFDRYCAKHIGTILKNPGNILEIALVNNQIRTVATGSPITDATLENVFASLEPTIAERVNLLLTKLQMSEKLAETIHNPGNIANDFETYLWANYIDKKNIGSYGRSLRDRLFSTQRRAPSGQVTRRLQFLKVAEADALDKIVDQRSANGQLKKLHDWARENVREFNTWEKICSDSTRFLPRSNRPMNS